MKVKHRYSIDQGTENLTELFIYLQRAVVCKTDDLIEREHEKYEGLKTKLNLANNDLKKVKMEYESNLKENARLKVISRNISLMQTLRREGILSDKRKNEIRKILHKIDSMSISELRNLEEKLLVLMPDKSEKHRFG